MYVETTSSTFTFRERLQWITIAVLVMALLTYAVYQARFLIIGPQIVLQSEPAIFHNEQRMFLEGTAFNISRLWLNDRQIFTDAQGNFREALILEQGPTITTLRAEDRYGRSTTLTRTFVYAPKSLAPRTDEHNGRE